MELIHIGFGNIVNADRIVAIVRPDAAPIKRLSAKAKAVLFMEDGAVVLSALLPETIRGRVGGEDE